MSFILALFLMSCDPTCSCKSLHAPIKATNRYTWERDAGIKWTLSDAAKDHTILCVVSLYAGVYRIDYYKVDGVGTLYIRDWNRLANSRRCPQRCKSVKSRLSGR